MNQKSQSTEFMQIDEEKEDYLNSEDSNKSPEYRIEFTQSNKIELIPKSLSNQIIQKLTETDTKINKQISQDLEIIEPENEKLFKTNILQRVQFLAENKITSIEIIEPVLLDKECEIIEFRKEQAIKANILRQESVQFLSQNNEIIYEKIVSKSPEIIQVEKEATQDTQESEESVESESDDDDGS